MAFSHHYGVTDRTKQVLTLAREEAVRLRHDYIGTEHILLGLVREGEGVAAAALTNLGIDLKQIREHIDESIRVGTAQDVEPERLNYTTAANSALEHATTEAKSLQHPYIGTEHLLLGLLREEKGIAGQVLESLGVTFERTRTEIRKLLGSVDE
jgi:ATP-dependent Clp protease ATP-binding subunit ClpC